MTQFIRGRMLAIRGRTVQATSREGVKGRMKIEAFVRAMSPPRIDTCDVILPDGIRRVRERGGVTLFVWEIPPQVYHVQWIDDGSPAPFGIPGKRVKYRHRRLAMPHIVMLAVFVTDSEGRLTLSSRNEAYFRNAPLTSGDDTLCFPALLNISKFPDEAAEVRPLAWVCTQHTPLDALAREPDDNQRIRNGLLALRRTVLETGFNYSSEHHELTSYWSLSAKKIPDVADLDRWEARTREDPLFALEVDWLPASWKSKPLTVNRLIERSFGIMRAQAAPLTTAAQLANVVFNHKASPCPI